MPAPIYSDKPGLQQRIDAMRAKIEALPSDCWPAIRAGALRDLDRAQRYLAEDNEAMSQPYACSAGVLYHEYLIPAAERRP